MNPSELLERLVEAGVLTAEGETAELTPEFVESRAEHRRAVSEMDAVEVESVLGSIGEGAEERHQRELLATKRAIGEHVEDLSDAAPERLAPVVMQFVETPGRTDGVPEPFSPIVGSSFTPLLRACERAVVYVWKEDCEPCDDQRSVLEEIFDDPPDDLALLAIYGPNALDVMDEYDVAGAPALLFVAGGRVDSRLFGAQHASTIEAEVAKIRETAEMR